MARQPMREDTRPSLTLKYDRCDLAPAIAPSTGLPNQTSAVHALPGNLPTTRLATSLIPFSFEPSRWMAQILPAMNNMHWGKVDVESGTRKSTEMGFTIN